VADNEFTRLYDVGDGKLKTIKEISEKTGYTENTVVQYLKTNSPKVLWNTHKEFNEKHHTMDRLYDIGDGEFRTLKEICQHTDFSVVYVTKLFERYSQAEIWKMRRGDGYKRNGQKNKVYYEIKSVGRKTVHEIAEHNGYSVEYTRKKLKELPPDEVWNMKKQ
jgi:DNA-binding IscR family transcriptional regulator